MKLTKTLITNKAAILRNGQITGPLTWDKNEPIYPVRVLGGKSWTADGKHNAEKDSTGYDIVSLMNMPKREEPPKICEKKQKPATVATQGVTEIPGRIAPVPKDAKRYTQEMVEGKMAILTDGTHIGPLTWSDAPNPYRIVCQARSWDVHGRVISYGVTRGDIVDLIPMPSKDTSAPAPAQAPEVKPAPRITNTDPPNLSLTRESVEGKYAIQRNGVTCGPLTWDSSMMVYPVRLVGEPVSGWTTKGGWDGGNKTHPNDIVMVIDKPVDQTAPVPAPEQTKTVYTREMIHGKFARLRDGTITGPLVWRDDAPKLINESWPIYNPRSGRSWTAYGVDKIDGQQSALDIIDIVKTEGMVYDPVEANAADSQRLDQESVIRNMHRIVVRRKDTGEVSAIASATATVIIVWGMTYSYTYAAKALEMMPARLYTPTAPWYPCTRDGLNRMQDAWHGVRS